MHPGRAVRHGRPAGPCYFRFLHFPLTRLKPFLHFLFFGGTAVGCKGEVAAPVESPPPAGPLGRCGLVPSG